MNKSVLLVILGTVLLWPFVVSGAVENPHLVLEICDTTWIPECDEVCWTCHGIAPPPNPTGIVNDGYLCGSCHVDEMDEEINHAVGVYYETTNLRSELVEEPQGVELFCDDEGQNCMVICSSCHYYHGRPQTMLRVDNRQSRLCFSCHIK